MPTPAKPILKIGQDTFNDLSSYNYDSSAEAFDDRGTLHYMYAGGFDNGLSAAVIEWVDGTASQYADIVRCKIPQLTYDVINGGTYNTSDNSVTYQSTNYKFVLARDGSGNDIAEAKVV